MNVFDEQFPPDTIPSIDNPKYRPRNTKIDNSKLGIVFVLNAHKLMFFPLDIMVNHEIVNDQQLGFSLTYCPLTQSCIVFFNDNYGANLKLGTSGWIYNGNLVVYDRKTGKMYSQILAKPVSGLHVDIKNHQIIREIDFDPFIDKDSPKLRIMGAPIMPLGEWNIGSDDVSVLDTDIAVSLNPYQDYWVSDNTLPNGIDLTETMKINPIKTPVIVVTNHEMTKSKTIIYYDWNKPSPTLKDWYFLPPKNEYISMFWWTYVVFFLLLKKE